MSAPDIVASLYGQNPPDWIILGCHYLTTIPKLLNKVDIPKAFFIEDTYPQVLRVLRKAYVEIGVSLAFHRYNEGIDLFEREFGRFCRDRFFWLPWAINPNEFKPDPRKMWDVSILGRTSYRYYDLRRKLLHEFQASDLNILHKPHPGCFRPGRGNRKPGSIVGQEYAEALARCHIGLTTGGIPKYPVCKFFEIPGSGSLLLGQDIPALGPLGFEDGVNMIVIDEEDPVGQVKSILEDSSRKNTIAAEGRRLIEERHTWEHRAITFFEALGHPIETLVESAS